MLKLTHTTVSGLCGFFGFFGLMAVAGAGFGACVIVGVMVGMVTMVKVNS